LIFQNKTADTYIDDKRAFRTTESMQGIVSPKLVAETRDRDGKVVSNTKSVTEGIFIKDKVIKS
jgi:hypothetical protein